MTLDIKWIPSPNHYDGRQGYKIKQIVIHTMEMAEMGTTAESCANYFATPGLQASAHYEIDNNSICQSVALNDGAWACPFFNRTGIHLEHAGFAAQTDKGWSDDYSQAMLHLSARLAAKLSTKYDIPVRRLTLDEVRKGTVKGFMGHWDATRAGVGGNNHTDPGKDFPWSDYLALVKHYQGKGKAPQPPKKKHKKNPEKLAVDGRVGIKTTKAIQKLGDGAVDGWLTGQASTIWSDDVEPTLKHCWPTLKEGKGGSHGVMVIQKVVGVEVDGEFGPKTRKGLQKYLNVKQDGLPGPETVKALQRRLNAGTFK